MVQNINDYWEDLKQDRVGNRNALDVAYAKFKHLQEHINSRFSEIGRDIGQVEGKYGQCTVVYKDREEEGGDCSLAMRQTSRISLLTDAGKSGTEGVL